MKYVKYAKTDRAHFTPKDEKSKRFLNIWLLIHHRKIYVFIDIRFLVIISLIESSCFCNFCYKRKPTKNIIILFT